MDRIKKFVAGMWDALNTVSGMWLWGWLGGRTFVFIMFALAAMVWLEYLGKLEAQLVAGLGVLAGLFSARAVADDYIQLQHRQFGSPPKDPTQP
jgi:hypothetical protein